MQVAVKSPGEFLQGAQFGLGIARLQTSDCRLGGANPFTKFALAHPGSHPQLLDHPTEVRALAGVCTTRTRPAETLPCPALIHSADAMDLWHSKLFDTPGSFKVCM